jgi:hypothetical protein
MAGTLRVAVSLNPVGGLGGQLIQPRACWLVDIDCPQGAQCRVDEHADPALHLRNRTEVDQQSSNLGDGVLAGVAVPIARRRRAAAALWRFSLAARKP